jgi:hypothetical protein
MEQYGYKEFSAIKRLLDEYKQLQMSPILYDKFIQQLAAILQV